MANVKYGVNIIPRTNNTYTIGNSDYKWANIYTVQLNGVNVANLATNSVATSSAAGLMSAADKAKLDTLSAFNATDYTVNIATTDWVNNSYTWTNSAITSTAYIIVNFTESVKDYVQGTLDYTKVTGGVQFNVESTPTGTITLIVGIIDGASGTSVGGGADIDDTTTALNKTWSSSKIDEQVIISSTQPSATSNKLWISNDSGIEVTVPTYSEFTTAIDGKVDDVQVNGTSIKSNGIANIPIIGANSLGVCSYESYYGIQANSSGRLYIAAATSNNVKDGTYGFNPIVPSHQHEAAFYGLAKAAGDSTQSASSNVVGVYTDSAKSAIQSMLAVSSSNNPIFTGSFSQNRKSNTTVGTNSFSSGDNCEASAEDSHAEGRYTIASGHYSHAEGNYTTASGMASHAAGTVTIANHASQYTFGEYNVEDSSSASALARGNYIEIVGNGTASNAKSNARALDWSGNEYLNGYIYVGCGNNSSNGTRIPHDIQINGTSIVNNGIVNIPYAYSTTTAGVVKIGMGLMIDGEGVVRINKALDDAIKAGNNEYQPITPRKQHLSAFYGLAKIAGDSTQSTSSNTAGIYTPEAKIAIQKMLGVYQQPWEFIREDTFTNATEADHTITLDANNEAFDLTDIIFMFETPKQETDAAKGSYGQIHFYYGTNDYFGSESGAWTQAANTSAHGFVVRIIQEPGGMFWCQETSQTTSSNSAPWRTRYYSTFKGSQGLRMLENNYVRHITKIVIKTVTGTGHYLLYGKRALT